MSDKEMQRSTGRYAGDFRDRITEARKEKREVEAEAELDKLKTENLMLLDEIEEWKDASGLERGGDPEAVTPDDLRDEIRRLRKKARESI